MHTDEFERAFSEFIDGREYDRAADGLFAIVRLAFEAGWRAAESQRRQTGAGELRLLSRQESR